MPHSILLHRLTIPQRIGLAAVLLCVLPLLALLVTQSLKSAPPETSIAEQPNASASELESTVSLTSEQIHSISLNVAPVQRMAIQPSTVVPWST